MKTIAGVRKTDGEGADLCGLTTDGSAHETDKLSCGALTKTSHTKVLKGSTTQQVCQSENFCQANMEVRLK